MKLTYKNTFKKITLFLLISIGSLSLFAQSPQEAYRNKDIATHQFDKEKWNKYAEEVDYGDYDSEEERQKAEEKRQREKSNGDTPLEDRYFDSSSTSFETVLAPFFKFLLIAGAIGLLIFLLIKLMDAESIFSPKNRKITSKASEIDLEDIEENLHESDLEGFIRQALAEQNYALAVRLYYLAILKELSLSNQIKWKKDKTNREYLREMGGKKLSKPFRETTLIFERVWYGTGELTGEVFEELQPKFKTLLKDITTSFSLNAETNKP